MKDKNKEKVYNIICDKAHGKEFYTKELFEELTKKLDVIYDYLDLNNGSDESKIDRINKYLMNNVKVRKEYFEAFQESIPQIPDSELIYRTGYAALIRGEAMCAGFTEAARMLLELSGLETKTLLSKLPGKNKYLLHYVTAIKYDRGSGRDYYIMDPEREKSCNDKGFDFRRYLMNMEYILPNEYFYENKVGINGVGPQAIEYLQNHSPRHVTSKNNVDELFDEKKWGDQK